MTADVLEPATLAQWQTVRFFFSVGWLVVLLTWEGAAPFFHEFGCHRERLFHAGRNWAVAVINALIVASSFSALWLGATEWGNEHHWGLVRLVSLPAPLACLLVIVLLDFWTYWWHRLNHRLPFLWRFHRMHHSDPKMDVTTANRFHFGEIILSSVLRVPVIFAIGADFWQLVVYETALQFVVQLHHANVALPPFWESLLSKIIVTPMIHKVHHSRVQEETDSNYSSLFSIWDRIFKSRCCSRNPEEIQYGLQGFDSEAKQSIGGLLVTPLRDTKGPPTVGE